MEGMLSGRNPGDMRAASFGTGARFTWFVSGLPDGLFEQYGFMDTYDALARLVKHSRDDVDASLGLEPVTYIRHETTSALWDYLEYVRRVRKTSSGAIVAARLSLPASAVHDVDSKFDVLMRNFTRVPTLRYDRMDSTYTVLYKEDQEDQMISEVSEVVVLSRRGGEMTPSERLKVIEEARSIDDVSSSKQPMRLVLTEYVIA